MRGWENVGVEMDCDKDKKKRKKTKKERANFIAHLSHHGDALRH